MTGLISKAHTAWALGLHNVLAATGYRLGIRLRTHPALRLKSEPPEGRFFREVLTGPIAAEPTSQWNDKALLFGRWPITTGPGAPNWLGNPLTGKSPAGTSRPWWEIPDFDSELGDIKLIWELSRMDWAIAFAQRARNGNTASLRRLNEWLADWCASNPPFRGPNWKCGQEASIRVIHLATAALILDQVEQLAPALSALVRMHLQRITSTLRYSMAQDNNHGTTEAAALFIGGSWLAANNVWDGVRWAKLGRRWLENRTARLIGNDGSFSQYSVNYHRMLLYTLSIAEVWRERLALPRFSECSYQQARLAVHWLFRLVDPHTGDAPNVGANDGARLLQLTDTPYRDYRPTVQLAMTLFEAQRAYVETNRADEALAWVGIDLPAKLAPRPGSDIGDDGGFGVLRHGGAMTMLRYPRFRFRPSQADALHCELWLNGENLLRDGGTFSYNNDPVLLAYFSGAKSHNLIEFDDRDQMPRIGRFLFGEWLKPAASELSTDAPDGPEFKASYRDWKNASHTRSVRLERERLIVRDTVAGFRHKAILRWRLRPGFWRLDGTRVSDGTHSLTVTASAPLARCELVQGWESRHYLERTILPVLEIEVHQPASLTTEYRWSG